MFLGCAASGKLWTLWLLLAVLHLAEHMAYTSPHLSVLREEARRAEQDPASTRRQSAAIVKSSAFQPGNTRTRHTSSYNGDGVPAQVCRGITKAERDAVRRRIGCNLLPLGFLSRRQKKASIAARLE